jgi:hypothetical protein
MEQIRIILEIDFHIPWLLALNQIAPILIPFRRPSRLYLPLMEIPVGPKFVLN